MKEEFFSKFIDYNKKLEEILEEKDFSEQVKNLLLSMLYKIEISYQDYENVKINVPNKAEFIGNILEMIEECKNIEIIKPTSEEGKQFERDKVHYKTDKLAHKIKTYENEKDMLEAIIDLNKINIFLPEKYNLIRIAFAEMLNEGNKNSDVEIIRDFNAWSWNILKEEISNIYYNIIYQNLVILLGNETIEEIFSYENTEDVIEVLVEELKKIDARCNIDEFLKLVYKISIDICISRNKLEKNRLLDEKKFLEIEYNELNNKEKYLNKITNIKKKNNIEIGKIDTILSNKELLINEYLKRNEKLPKFNKLFSVTHLQEILNKQRKKLLAENEKCNKKLEPHNYVKYKEEIEEQLYLLSNVDKEKLSTKIIEENVISLQEKFINIFEQKLEKTQDKEEYIKFVYLIRYYKYIPLEKQYIKDVKEIEKLIDNLEEKLLIKLWKQKTINKFIPENEINIRILKNIFNTRIINLTSMQIKVIKKQDKINVEIYDAEILEKTVEIDLGKNEKINIKLNKNIKIIN